jgi:hypothetical protein
MMKVRVRMLFKRNVFFMAHIECILLLGMLSMLLPIRGMEAVCPAQPTSPGQATSQTNVQPGQPPLSPAPVLSPGTSHRGQFTLNFDDADVYTIIQTIFGEIDVPGHRPRSR